LEEEAMTARAQVLFGGTTLQLPARTDYEREILFDYVQDAAHRHGRVQLRAGRYSCTLRPARRSARLGCDHCRRRIRVVLCELGKVRLCLPCLWRLIVAKHEAPAAPPTANALTS
jgi:hypothetical protein